ncbi:hypothetical protein GCM10008983_00870 [Lentibacillus halophilus]|uniref:X-X-X-Leu-X-X-Gly heptad repeat-containing protein n=1 Tax=Lentibacillus halophilus TaxID=295065 RepID=A0ABN0Z198_9BACI
MQPNKLVIALMSAVLILGSPSWAVLAEKADNDGSAQTQDGAYSEKDETIYGNLGATGTLQDMYVVNTFHITKPGDIVDHGNYTDVRNLSNLKTIDQSGNTIRFQAEGDEFYYQGDLNKRPLPWNIAITYVLDGEEVAPDQLAGKSGELEMRIHTSGNDKADPAFFNNYMLQLTMTLGPETFDHIQAPDGTKATSGKDTQVTFTAMPEKEKMFIVSANVTDFEMDPVSISATPASMPIENPNLGDMTSDIRSLSHSIRDINQGVGDLNDRISDLRTGAADVNNGSKEFLNSINSLDQQSSELVTGSADIRDALKQMNQSMQKNTGTPDLSDLKTLPGGLRDLAKGLRGAADGLDTLKESYSKAYGQLNEAIQGIPDYDIKDNQIKALLQNTEDQNGKAVIKKLSETYKAARQAKGIYQASRDVFDSVSSTLGKTAGHLRSMADKADNKASELDKNLKNMDQMDGLKELQEGLSSLSSQYQTFHSGLVDYTDGLGRLTSTYQDIHAGIGDLEQGASALDSGASDLKNGTQELQKETSDLPSEMQSEVDDMMEGYDASDFEPKSYVSDQNKNVDVVQFVLQTEPIKKEDDDTSDNVEDDKENNGFWERLKNLFQ